MRLGRFGRVSREGKLPKSLRMAESGSVAGLLLGGERHAGLDVARDGDRCVLRARTGPIAAEEHICRTLGDSMASVGEVVLKLNEWGIVRLKVETDGQGAPVYDRLKELRREGAHSAEVVPVQMGSAARQSERFLNLRAEIWWEIGREYSRLKKWDLTNCDDETLAELTVSKYQVLDSKGKIKIEPKDNIKARLGRSPDRADALLLAYYEPWIPAKTAPTSMYNGNF